MLIARKIIFYLFLLIYCILCPILIMYSFGYILNPVNKEIAQTGLIHIETIPAGADIFLGRSHYEYKTPASIVNLVPGQYQITVKLKGHRLWSHEVSVREGQSSAFNNILLLPKKLNPKILISQPDYQNLILLPETNSFILRKSPQLKDFYIFDWGKGQLQPLLKRYGVYTDFLVSDIYPRMGNKKIVIFGGSLWNKKFYLIDLGDRDQPIVDITKLFDGKPNKFVWNTVYKNNCFAIYNDYVNRLDLKEMSLYPKFIEDVKGFGLSDRWLYSLGKDNRISKMTLDEAHRVIIFEDRNFGKNIFNKSHFYEIKFISDENILFLGNKGDLIMTLPPFVISESGVLGTSYHNPSQKLLFWSKNTIGVVDFTQGDGEGLLFSDRIIVKTVYAQGKNIIQCFWAYDGTHVIFRDGAGVFLLELLSGAKPHIEPIVNTKNNSDVLYSDETGSLYYLDPKGRLLTQKIIPSAPFIETDQKKEE